MDSLKSVQWVYLAIAIFVFILAGVFFLSYVRSCLSVAVEIC